MITKPRPPNTATKDFYNYDKQGNLVYSKTYYYYPNAVGYEIELFSYNKKGNVARYVDYNYPDSTIDITTYYYNHRNLLIKSLDSSATGYIDSGSTLHFKNLRFDCAVIYIYKGNKPLAELNDEGDTIYFYKYIDNSTYFRYKYQSADYTEFIDKIAVESFFIDKYYYYYRDEKGRVLKTIVKDRKGNLYETIDNFYLNGLLVKSVDVSKNLKAYKSKKWITYYDYFDKDNKMVE